MATTPNYASFWRRLAAYLVDGIVVGVFNGVVVSLLPRQQTLGLIITLVFGWGYYIYFIGNRGATPGKMLLKIKVVRVEGEKIGYLNAFVREVVGKFISSLPLLLGFLWMLWDKKKQTWHDKIAQTTVVRTG